MQKKKIIKKFIYKSVQVLEFIIDASLTLPESLVGKDMVYKGCRSIFDADISDSLIKQSVSHNIVQLKRYGYIEEKNNSLVLTNKAKLKYVDKYSNNSQKDNKYRFISYDIPEKYRLRRDQFRNSIKKMGFIKIQKSLWVSDQNVNELLEMAIEEFKVEDYVIYFVSESSNVDKMLHLFLNQTKDQKDSDKKRVDRELKKMDFTEFKKKVRW